MTHISFISTQSDTYHTKFSYSCAFTGIGEMVEGIVIHLTTQRSPIPSGGLEIKLKLYFRGPKVSLVEQLRSSRSRCDLETEKQPMIDQSMILTMMLKETMKKMSQYQIIKKTMNTEVDKFDCLSNFRYL